MSAIGHKCQSPKIVDSDTCALSGVTSSTSPYQKYSELGFRSGEFASQAQEPHGPERDTGNSSPGIRCQALLEIKTGVSIKLVSIKKKEEL